MISQGAEVANTLVTSVLSVWPGCSDCYPEPVYFHLCSALLSLSSPDLIVRVVYLSLLPCLILLEEVARILLEL